MQYIQQQSQMNIEAQLFCNNFFTVPARREISLPCERFFHAEPTEKLNIIQLAMEHNSIENFLVMQCKQFKYLSDYEAFAL